MPHQQADHVCPPWIGFISLLNPLRKILYAPGSILGPYVTEGMTAIEPGPGMGFFTLELARRVGPNGRVVALDIQAKMLEALRGRARRANLLDRIETRLIQADGLGIRDLNGKADFFLAFAMAHEVPDPSRFFKEAFAALKPGGRLLFAEPNGHVSKELFDRELTAAEAAGFRVENRPAVRMSRAALLSKNRKK